jgi:2-methylisocitrate lyase-like PEP mutase family enzyme
VPLVINAPCGHLPAHSATHEPDRVAETIRRGRLHREAGADRVYPINVREKDDIATLVTEPPCPSTATATATQVSSWTWPRS